MCHTERWVLVVELCGVLELKLNLDPALASLRDEGCKSSFHIDPHSDEIEKERNRIGIFSWRLRTLVF